MKNLIITMFFICSTAGGYAAKVDTLTIRSAAMGKELKAAVVLPESYARGKTSYPVVYLLHGAYGYFGDWLKKTPELKLLHMLSDQYDIIIVTPEGEKFSFYIDSPVNPQSSFETHISSELINTIDGKYRTVKSKSGRAITGLSMGGHGALYLSGKHPELYAAAGSMSGAVDMGSMLNRENAETVKQLMLPVFGADSGKAELYEQHSVLGMVPKMKTNALPLIIDCGVDDFLLEANRELHRRLLYMKVPHEYTERPGAHTWEYWANALPYHMLYFYKIFLENGTAVRR